MKKLIAVAVLAGLFSGVASASDIKSREVHAVSVAVKNLCAGDGDLRAAHVACDVVVRNTVLAVVFHDEKAADGEDAYARFLDAAGHHDACVALKMLRVAAMGAMASVLE